VQTADQFFLFVVDHLGSECRKTWTNFFRGILYWNASVGAEMRVETATDEFRRATADVNGSKSVVLRRPMDCSNREAHHGCGGAAASIGSSTARDESAFERCRRHGPMVLCGESAATRFAINTT